MREEEGDGGRDGRGEIEKEREAEKSCKQIRPIFS